MTSDFQTVAALVVVAIAAAWLALRLVARKKKSGCGGDCGCPTSELKSRGKLR